MLSRRLSVVGVATLLLLGIAGLPAAHAQPAPPPPLIENRLAAPVLDGPRDVVERVLDYPARIAIPAHTHPGPNFATLITGEVTLSIEGQPDQVFHAGDSWIEPPNTVHWGVAGDSPIRLITATIVPRGAQQAMLAPAPAGAAPAAPLPPATVETRVEAPDLSGPRDVIQTVQDLPPDAFAGPHTHPGPQFAVLVEGQVTLTRAPGGDSNYVAGDAWFEAANLLHWAQFGPGGAYQYAAAVVPSGAPRAIPAAAPAPAAPAPAPAQVP